MDGIKKEITISQKHLEEILDYCKDKNLNFEALVEEAAIKYVRKHKGILGILEMDHETLEEKAHVDGVHVDFSEIEE